jgi:hypothetical protein
LANTLEASRDTGSAIDAMMWDLMRQVKKRKAW